MITLKVSKKVIIAICIIVVIIIVVPGILHLPPPGERPPENIETPWIFKDQRLNRVANISLPVNISDLPTDPHMGGLTTWGFHGGNHPEGFDHTGFAAEEVIPVYAPDYGVVAYVEEDVRENEYKVVIFHNFTIASWFDHLTGFVAEEHDEVQKGQLIGYTKAEYMFSILDWALIDFNNNTGPLFTLYRQYKNGSFVPPFDYLSKSELEEVMQYFNQTLLTPFLNGEVIPHMNKAEHDLVNPVFPKSISENDLAGVWVYQDYWERGGYPEILVFIHKKTKYFGEVYHAVYSDYIGFCKFASWEANYEIDTSTKPYRIKITFDYTGPNPPPREIGPIYGIFEVGIVGNRKMLRIELSKEGYPTSFSDNATIYFNRSRDHPLNEAKFKEGGQLKLSTEISYDYATMSLREQMTELIHASYKTLSKAIPLLKELCIMCNSNEISKDKQELLSKNNIFV